MQEGSLLVLALLAVGETPPPAEAFVRAVRVEAEQPERLLPFPIM